MDNVLPAIMIDSNGVKHKIVFTKPKKPNVVYDYAFDFDREEYGEIGEVTIVTKLVKFKRDLTLLFSNAGACRHVSAGILVLPNKVEVDWRYGRIGMSASDYLPSSNPHNIGVKMISRHGIGSRIAKWYLG